MTPEQRAGAGASLVANLRELKTIATRTPPECEPFLEALRTRTGRALVTPALIAVNGFVFVAMLLGPGALASPETLVRWGGNFGPRTTNGEWWRLITATFVHSGFWNVVIEMLGLLQIGLILERAVGYFSIVATYFAAAAIASLVALALHPVGVNVGAAGAVCGIYGLMVAAFGSGMLRRDPLRIPLRSATRLIPAGVLFSLYVLMSDEVDLAAALAAFAVGIAAGMGLMM